MGIIVYNYIRGGDDTMYENMFAKRLTELRMQKGVSARDMSLSIGQSESYINKIENGVSLPSMITFFYICEYLGITLSEFFDFETEHPAKTHSINELLKKLDSEQLDIIEDLIKNMIK